MPTTEERRAHYDEFVADILTLCRDNGTRAALATGRGSPVNESPRMHRYLTHRVAGYGAKRAHYTIASLIALQRPRQAARPTPPTAAHTPTDTEPVPWRARPNFGRSLALAVRDHGFNASPTENLLYTLTALSADVLQPLLWSHAKRLLGAGAAIDWAVLLEDLAWWDYDQPEVTTRWQESFHLTLELPSPPQES